MKKGAYSIVATVVIVVIAFAAIAIKEAVRYPSSGNFFQIVGVNKSDIIAVEIIHFGDVVRITEKKSMDSLLSALDSSMNRQLFYRNFTGGDWTLRLITEDDYIQFLLLPYSLGKIDTRLLWNDRMYILETQIELSDMENFLLTNTEN